MAPDSGFYVGYQKQAPLGVARFVRGVVLLVVISAASLAAVLATVQDRFDPGVFEYGVVRGFEGVIEEFPHPVLLVDGSAEGPTRYFLVGLGKRGAAPRVAGLDGQRVRLEGTLIYREGETMIEIASGSIETLGAAPSDREDPAASLAVHTLVGEIVDSKCFFGVMKPGRGKPHRACAARCISGGVPPVLRVETADGSFHHYLLVDERGGTVNERVLDLVAEPIEITGNVVQRGNLLFLEADPASYVRIREP